MSAYFFDSSALYKRYVYEPGSNWVKAVCEARGARSSSYIAQIARIEVVAASYRAGRLARLHAALIDSAAAEFKRQ